MAGAGRTFMRRVSFHRLQDLTSRKLLAQMFGRAPNISYGRNALADMAGFMGLGIFLLQIIIACNNNALQRNYNPINTFHFLLNSEPCA